MFLSLSFSISLTLLHPPFLLHRIETRIRLTSQELRDAFDAESLSEFIPRTFGELNDLVRGADNQNVFKLRVISRAVYFSAIDAAFDLIEENDTFSGRHGTKSSPLQKKIYLFLLSR